MFCCKIEIKRNHQKDAQVECCIYCKTFQNTIIVLNQKSYSIASKFNSKCKLMSAFIPPIKTEILEEQLQLKIDSLKTSSDYIFCTNAYSHVYDKNRNEIYGILPLINLFNNYPKLGLILSDPKGEYQNYFLLNNYKVNNNIIILNKNHSFFEVIKQSDCLIRNTTIDGDSLSINEALFCRKPVIATDCVSRPNGVITYGESTSLSLENAIIKASKNNNYKPKYIPSNCATELIELYKSQNK